MVSVGRLLRTLGLSPQRALWRGYPQDPAAVQRWKTKTYPAVRTEAARVGATIYFADEAGVRADDHATWAPVGQTPVVATTDGRHTINLIFVVTAAGALRFAAYHSTLTASTFLCQRLLYDATGPVFLIFDGHPVHRSNAVTTFAVGTDGQLRLFFLPSYSPELNPDEWGWKNVKTDRIGRAGLTSAGDLTNKALATLHRLQASHLIRGFLTNPKLRYITTHP